jgi:hypothetical protein
MKIGIMQPYFLPYIGYWQLIKAVDKYVVYDDVQYIKGGWINRNRMLLDGKDFMFNLLLSKASPNKLINEIEVLSDQTKLLRTIESAYKKATQYDIVFPLMKSIVEYEDKNLAKYVGNSIMKIAGYMDVNAEIIYSSDIREKNCNLKAQEKILHICKLLSATEYINTVSGKDLYCREDFRKKGIDLKFLCTESVRYKQFNNEFVPFMSVLDVMMFNSAEEIKIMLDKYELI